MSGQGTAAAGDLLGRVLSDPPSAFALLYRPDTRRNELETYVGDISTTTSISDISVPESPTRIGSRHQEVLALIPFRQIVERGFVCADDSSPLLSIAIREQEVTSLGVALPRLPSVEADMSPGRFDVGDAEYADVVRAVIADEIGQGAGANFVIKRSFVAEIRDFSVQSALAFFRRLIERESGAYWTFFVHTGDRTFVGASPERHLSLNGGTAVMNPISGTYRYPPAGPTLPQVLRFLADRKETDELSMVLDEELKMMARICDGGVRVVGPFLKEMGKLAHTEYYIEGRTSREVREILVETMFAPTVVGSPLESACDVIRRHEPHGRGYYGGVAALIGRDERGRRTLDSSILIRTADIDRAGCMRIGVGATLVRHSNPADEVAETQAKAAGLLAALGTGAPARFSSHPDVVQALALRNEGLAEFWIKSRVERTDRYQALAGRRVLVVDAEDSFTSMIQCQLRALGLSVTVRRWNDMLPADGNDFVIMGPGPGDPRILEDPKVAALRTRIRLLLNDGQPFLAVCLSHQVLSGMLGFEVVRKRQPNQGLQKEIDLFGRRVRVGFYNTFVAQCGGGASMPADVDVSRDSRSGEVHALRGPGFGSLQFHPESVLTEDGLRIVADMLTDLLPVGVGDADQLIG